MKGEAKTAGPAKVVEITDEALMARFQKGDDNAFSLLIDRHGGSLRRRKPAR